MKILLSGRWFPVAMCQYWRMGFEALGHTVITAGQIDPRGPDIVPWSPPASFPQYAQAPDVLLPNVDIWPLEQALAMVSEPIDLIVQAGDTVWLEGDAPKGVPNVIVATDPHAVDVHPRLSHADLFVCMQDYYLQRDFADYAGAKTWVPYGYEPTIHRYLPGSPEKYDVAFIGLLYPHRADVLSELARRGLRVLNTLGIAYHEGNELYNQGKIAFNWSSQQDVPARIFEGMAQQRLVVTNRLPDLGKLGFEENIHYVGFSDKDEAVEKIIYYLGHPEESARIAAAGHTAVAPMTWANRAQQLIDAVRAENTWVSK